MQRGPAGGRRGKSLVLWLCKEEGWRCSEGGEQSLASVLVQENSGEPWYVGQEPVACGAHTGVYPGVEEEHQWSWGRHLCFKDPPVEASLHPPFCWRGFQAHRLQQGLSSAGRSLVWLQGILKEARM